MKEALANTQFRVERDIGSEIIAHVSGKMRKTFIRIISGDRVKMEISPASRKGASRTVDAAPESPGNDPKMPIAYRQAQKGT